MSLVDLAEQLNMLSEIQKSWEGVIQIGFYPDADSLLAASIFAKVLIEREQPFVIFECRSVISELSDRKGSNYILIGHMQTELQEIPDSINFIGIVKPADAKPHQNIMNAKIYEYDYPEITLTALAYLMCEPMVTNMVRTRDYITILPLVAQQAILMKSKPRGLQEQIHNQAMDIGLISEVSTISILGSDIFSINEALVYSQDPFLPNLTDNENKVTQLLAKADIVAETSQGYRKFSDLEFDELKQLNIELVSYIQNNSGLKLNQLNFIAKKVILTQEPDESILTNTWDFARAVLDAINRKQTMLAVSVVVGNRGQKLRQLTKIYKEERQAFVTSFDFLLNRRDEIIELDYLSYMKTDKKISWYNAALVSGMIIAAGMAKNTQPFVSIVPGPENQVTLGLKVSSDISIQYDYKGLVGTICEERGLETSIIGDELEAQWSVPINEWEGVLVDLNTKLGGEI